MIPTIVPSGPMTDPYAAVMRFSSVGDLRRIDLDPLLALLPAVRAEWAGLRFDEGGAAIDPITGAARPSFRLVDGTHRQPGARYEAVIESPHLELPEHLQEAFASESVRLQRASAAEREAHRARRAAAMVQTGVDRHTFVGVLHRDDVEQVDVTVTDEDQRWSVDVTIGHGRLPLVDLAGQVDITALLRTDGTPGCLAGFLGGSGEAGAIADATTLEGRGGRLIEVGGRANRFHGHGHVDVATSIQSWSVKAHGALRARGLGRLVLLFTRSSIRHQVDKQLAELWCRSEARVDDAERSIAHLDGLVRQEGGEAGFVRRAIWDLDFDPRLPNQP